MTLILGLNTQYGVYLAADSRLSFPEGHYQDDCLKFYSTNKYIHAVVAGDASFASYLMQKIEKSELKNADYKVFIEKIKDFVQQEAGLYPWINKANPVAFIFAGFEEGGRKRISMERVVEHTRIMQRRAGGAPVRQNLHPSIVEAMLQKAIHEEKGSILETDLPPVHLFSLEINPSGGISIEVKEAEWGESMVFGPNNSIATEDIPPELLSDLDLQMNNPDETGQDRINSNVVRIVLFYDLVRRKAEGDKKLAKDIQKIGGSVPVFFVSDNGLLMTRSGRVKHDDRTAGTIRIISDVVVKPKGIYGRTDSGIMMPLRPIRDLYSKKRVEQDMQGSLI